MDVTIEMESEQKGLDNNEQLPPMQRILMLTLICKQDEGQRNLTTLWYITLILKYLHKNLHAWEIHWKYH